MINGRSGSLSSFWIAVSPLEFGLGGAAFGPIRMSHVTKPNIRIFSTICRPGTDTLCRGMNEEKVKVTLGEMKGRS